MRRLNRRQLLTGSAAAMATLHGWDRIPRAHAQANETHRITLAQVVVTRNVEENLGKARDAFEQARKDKAGWILFPEMFLSGYYADFEQRVVARAFSELETLCKQSDVIGLIGTGWKENGNTYNQIRIVDRDGKLASAYAKTCLCYGEANWTDKGPFPMIHSLHGITFGTLICNDLWVTPGFSDGPNPHLSLKQAKAGAQVIFHAINSGSDQRYRAYHESNLLLRAAEAKCPIVAVNAFKAPAPNASSGVVGPHFQYLAQLPRDREVVQTVEFSVAKRN